MKNKKLNRQISIKERQSKLKKSSEKKSHHHSSSIFSMYNLKSLIILSILFLITFLLGFIFIKKIFENISLDKQIEEKKISLQKGEDSRIVTISEVNKLETNVKRTEIRYNKQKQEEEKYLELLNIEKINLRSNEDTIKYYDKLFEDQNQRLINEKNLMKSNKIAIDNLNKRIQKLIESNKKI
jgi:hypothetical protein